MIINYWSKLSACTALGCCRQNVLAINGIFLSLHLFAFLTDFNWMCILEHEYKFVVVVGEMEMVIRCPNH